MAVDTTKEILQYWVEFETTEIVPDTTTDEEDTTDDTEE